MSLKTDRWWAAALAFDRNDLSWVPFLAPAIPIEEYRSEDRYVVRAELPGVDPGKDIRIACVSGALRLYVRRDEAHREATRSEFRYGSFSRTMPLPDGARTDRVTVRYTNGILEITVPVGKG
jgi:HSP20 family protein